MRSAGILGVDLEVDAGAEIARRSRGTPRIANRLLRRVRDFAEVRADGIVTMDVAQAALAVYDVDQLGFGPSRPFGTECFGAVVRRRARRRVDAGGGRRRGTVDGGRSVRAVPGPGRDDRPDAARTCGYRRCLDSTRNDTAAGCRSGRYRGSCQRTAGHVVRSERRVNFDWKGLLERPICQESSATNGTLVYCVGPSGTIAA